MKIIRAKNLKPGMYFYGRVKPGSHQADENGIEMGEFSGVITEIVEGGCSDTSLTITIDDDEEFQLLRNDKVAIMSRA